MDFIIIYSDMVGGTQALEITADSWEAASDGLMQRLRDNQEVVEGVNKGALNFFPLMVIKASDIEIKRVTAYVDNDGVELCDYTENFQGEGQA
jgi:hypothetical protein